MSEITTEQKNALLAEKVMGWALIYPYISSQGNWVINQGNDGVVVDGERDAVYMDGRGTLQLRPVQWNPLESIEQAMMLVEKLGERGWYFNIFWDLMTWVAKFVHVDNHDRIMITREHSYTPASAICEAILQTIDTQENAD